MAMHKLKVAGVKWVRPDDKRVKLEYKVEVENRRLTHLFDGFDDFKRRVDGGEVVSLSESEDRKMDYRSRTVDKEDLLGLISNYRSYPEFRNEQTVQHLYDVIGGKESGSMDMPMVLRWPDGRTRVLSGNTRLDISFQLGETPKVLMVNVERKL